MKRPGKLVRTKSGKIGRTYSDEPLVKGKVKVYLMQGSKVDKSVGLISDPASLKVIGFVD